MEMVNNLLAWDKSPNNVSHLLGPLFYDFEYRVLHQFKRKNNEFNFNGTALEVVGFEGTPENIEKLQDVLITLASSKVVGAYVAERFFSREHKESRYHLWEMKFNIGTDVVLLNEDDVALQEKSVGLLTSGDTKVNRLAIPIFKVEAHKASTTSWSRTTLENKLGQKDDITEVVYHSITVGDDVITLEPVFKDIEYKFSNKNMDTAQPNEGLEEGQTVRFQYNGNQKVMKQGILKTADLEEAAIANNFGYYYDVEIKNSFGNTVWRNRKDVVVEVQVVDDELIEQWSETALRLIDREMKSYSVVKANILNNLDCGLIGEVIKELQRIENERVRDYLEESLKLVFKFRRSRRTMQEARAIILEEIM